MAVLLTVRIVAGPANWTKMVCVLNRASLKTKCRMCWQSRDNRRVRQVWRTRALEQTTAVLI